jgi:hypothetical protein
MIKHHPPIMRMTYHHLCQYQLKEHVFLVECDHEVDAECNTHHTRMGPILEMAGMSFHSSLLTKRSSLDSMVIIGLVVVYHRVLHPSNIILILFLIIKINGQLVLKKFPIFLLYSIIVIELINSILVLIINMIICSLLLMIMVN